MTGHHVLQLLLQPGTRQDAIEEVRPIERADELERLLQLQLRGDVAADAPGRRRREGVQADAGKALPQRAELPVFGTEIVAPLADAVRLVDGDVGNAAEPLHEGVAALAGQPLGGHVKQRVALPRECRP